MLLKAEASAPEEISLRELALLVWGQKLLVLSLVVVCTFAAAAIASLLPKQYRATVELVPVSTSGAGARLPETSSSLTDLTSLIGISIGGDSEKYESIAVLQSRELTEQYLRDNRLLPILFGPPRTWIGRTLRKVLPPAKPTLWEGDNRFGKLRTVIEDRRTGIYTLAITWRNPQLAAKWANDLVKLTNDYLRGRAITVSEQHITYLQQQAANGFLQQTADSAMEETRVAARRADRTLRVPR